MVLKIYNTLTRKKEEFVPLDKKGKKVGLYGCGPTVYWYQHIGNMKRYVFEDTLYRVLIYNGFSVKHIINVTDVGHLTSDADEGEDKVEAAAKKENKTAKEIAEHYFNAFLEDIKKLNIIEPDIWPKATEHIQEMIDIVKILEDKGYTYKTSDGIYFDTSKLKDYGKLAKLDIEGLEEGHRVNIGEKRNKTDFALWKFSNSEGQESKRQQEWNPKDFADVDWQVGFPGWHIECSAMSWKYLGKQFDIHTGGIDHPPVHHTNEIAQSEAAFDVKPWVKYWMHNHFLDLKDGKMSKSKGEIIRVKELEEKGFSAIEFRYLCLGTHYRKPVVFGEEQMKDAKNAYQRLRNIISELKEDNEINKEYLKKFENVINDDLNIPEALQVLWRLLRDKNAKGKLKTIKKMDEVLGLNLMEAREEEIEIPEDVQKLIKERETARKNKNFEKADELRDKIKKQGFQINDTKEGVKVKKID